MSFCLKAWLATTLSVLLWFLSRQLYQSCHDGSVIYISALFSKEPYYSALSCIYQIFIRYSVQKQFLSEMNAAKSICSS